LSGEDGRLKAGGKHRAMLGTPRRKPLKVMSRFVFVCLSPATKSEIKTQDECVSDTASETQKLRDPGVSVGYPSHKLKIENVIGRKCA
jgi:hypothetical protein